MLSGVGILVILLAVERKKHSAASLVCLAVFGLYLLAVISQVIFPIPGPEAIGTRSPLIDILAWVNLVPFDFGRLFENNPTVIFQQLVGNILLTLPFGFGLPFVAHIRAKDMLWLALGAGLTLETAQLAICLATGASYRSVDINDMLLNAAGALLGYALFRARDWGINRFLGTRL
jgi:glycopeptide antibiotics resistance protein